MTTRTKRPSVAPPSPSHSTVYILDGSAANGGLPAGVPRAMAVQVWAVVPGDVHADSVERIARGLAAAHGYRFRRCVVEMRGDVVYMPSGAVAMFDSGEPLPCCALSDAGHAETCAERAAYLRTYAAAAGEVL